MANIERKSVKISPKLYFDLKELAIIEGREIAYLLDRAVSNYLKIKLGNRLKIPK